MTVPGVYRSLNSEFDTEFPPHMTATGPIIAFSYWDIPLMKPHLGTTVRLWSNSSRKSNAKKESDEIASTPEIREAMKILRIHDLNNEPIEAEILTFGLGDACIVALPGEIFVELGLAIKENSPYKNTLVLTLANNSIGYIPNKEAFKYGAYEVEVSMIAEGEGEKLVESSLYQMEKMKQ